MGCDQETVRAAEKIILPGDRDRLGCVTQIRVRATCQRDEFSLCTSKFESDHPSHAVGLTDVQKRRRSSHYRPHIVWSMNWSFAEGECTTAVLEDCFDASPQRASGCCLGR